MNSSHVAAGGVGGAMLTGQLAEILAYLQGTTAPVNAEATIIVMICGAAWVILRWWLVQKIPGLAPILEETQTTTDDTGAVTAQKTTTLAVVPPQTPVPAPTPTLIPSPAPPPTNIPASATYGAQP